MSSGFEQFFTYILSGLFLTFFIDDILSDVVKLLV